MKKQVNSKRVAEQKTLDLEAIQAIAGKAGMTASELLEWGLYSILETYDGRNGQISDAKEDLKRVRTLEGKIPKQLIPSDPLSKFTADAGLNFGELNELALLSAINILNTSEFYEKQPKEMLEDDRREKGPLIPSFLHDRVEVHPFMARLFSGDLKAVHGATFGDLSSEHVAPEHLFFRDSLRSAFGLNNWEDTICQLMGMEPAIRYCPTLQNEAAAIRALIEAEHTLGDFCRAVDAC